MQDENKTLKYILTNVTKDLKITQKELEDAKFNLQLSVEKQKIINVFDKYTTDIHKVNLCLEIPFFFEKCKLCHFVCSKKYCNCIIKKTLENNGINIYYIDEYRKITNNLCFNCFRSKVGALKKWIKNCNDALEKIKKKKAIRKEWLKDSHKEFLVNPDIWNILKTSLSESYKDLKEEEKRKYHQYNLCSSINSKCYICDKSQCYNCKLNYEFAFLGWIEIYDKNDFYDTNSSYSTKYESMCLNCIRNFLNEYKKWDEDMQLKIKQINKFFLK